MIILQDTREQLPLEFKHPQIEGVRKVTLRVGDYGCLYKDGHSCPVFFERKNIPDLFSTLSKGHDRFRKEIARAREFEQSLILIIEGTMSKVAKGYKYSSVKGQTIIKTLFTLWLKYGIVPIFCKNRKEMTEYIIQFYLGVGRERLRTLGVTRLHSSVAVS